MTNAERHRLAQLVGCPPNEVDEMSAAERAQWTEYMRTTWPGSHQRPRDGKPCAYLAEDFCNKCGWLHPRFARWKPSALAAFAVGASFGAFLTALFLLTLLGGR